MCLVWVSKDQKLLICMAFPALLSPSILQDVPGCNNCPCRKWIFPKWNWMSRLWCCIHNSSFPESGWHCSFYDSPEVVSKMCTGCEVMRRRVISSVPSGRAAVRLLSAGCHRAPAGTVQTVQSNVSIDSFTVQQVRSFILNIVLPYYAVLLVYSFMTVSTMKDNMLICIVHHCSFVLLFLRRDFGLYEFVVLSLRCRFLPLSGQAMVLRLRFVLESEIRDPWYSTALFHKATSSWRK